MTKNYCDRCEKLLSPYTLWKRIKFVKKYIFFDERSSFLEICPDCYNTIKEFIKNP